MLEYRTAVDGVFKDIDEGKRQVLVEFPHDVVDSYKTTFGNDCFRESFEARKPTMAWMHDMKEPIGRAVSAQVGTRANELVGQFSDFDAVPLAKRAFSQIKDGSITDFSFGFSRQKDEPHPEHRGVLRITKALMREFSPVMVGSIPGAVAVGTRADNEGELLPSAKEIADLVKRDVIRPEEARAMLATIPGYREHITLGATPAVESVEPAAPIIEPPVTEARDEDLEELAESVDAALNEAVRHFDDMTPDEIAALPANVQQGLALTRAAAAAAMEQLNVMGLLPEERSMSVSDKPWSGFTQADYTPAQYKTACLIWNGADDEKASGSLPVKEPDGTLNKNGMAAAAGRLEQTDAPAADKQAAAKKLLGLYNQAGLKPPPTLLKVASSRSDEEIESTEPDVYDELGELFSKVAAA